jgi:hypothetical protein
MTEHSAETPQAAYRFRDADLAAYGEYELQRLEEVLRLRKADQMALVATAICEKIGWHVPHGPDVGPSSMPITPSFAKGWKAACAWAAARPTSMDDRPMC